MTRPEPYRSVYSDGNRYALVIYGSLESIAACKADLFACGYAQPNDWSPAVPNPNNPAQSLSLLSRRYLQDP